MAELVGKYATDGATGRRSASPGEELFSRFREAFETIDFTALNTIVVRFDWNMFEGTAVAVMAREAKARMVEAMKEGAFCRGDYHLATFLRPPLPRRQTEAGRVVQARGPRRHQQRAIPAVDAVLLRPAHRCCINQVR